ncbi:MAG: hypothetical protein AB1585_05955 [Thermodesulfobacteriota bacterium]
MSAPWVSPLANQRTDKYGGSLENRSRFLLELTIALREALGKDLLLTLFFVRCSQPSSGR